MKEKKKKRKFSILDEEYSVEEIKGAKKSPIPPPLPEEKKAEDETTKRVRLRMKIVDLPLKSKVELLKSESKSHEEYLSLVTSLIGNPDEIFGKLALTKEFQDKTVNSSEFQTPNIEPDFSVSAKEQIAPDSALEADSKAQVKTDTQTSTSQKESNIRQTGEPVFSSKSSDKITSGIKPVVETSSMPPVVNSTTGKDEPVVMTSGKQTVVENTTYDRPVVLGSSKEPVVPPTSGRALPVVNHTTSESTQVVENTTDTQPLVETRGQPPVVNSTTGHNGPVVSTSSTQPVVDLTSGLNSHDYNESPSVDKHELKFPKDDRTFDSPDKDRTALDPVHSQANEQVNEELLGYLLEAVPSKKAEVEERPGWTKYPNELIQFAAKRIKGKAALNAWNCLMSYSCGYHRDFCYLSLGHFAEWSGIGDRSNASKAIKSLIADGIVKIVKEPNSKKQEATVYQIIPVTAYFKRTRHLHPNFNFWDEQGNYQTQNVEDSGIKPVVNLTTGDEPQVVDSATSAPPVVSNYELSNLPRASGNQHHTGVVKSTTNKESPKNSSNNSLSLGSDFLEDHLRTLGTAPLQREAELKNLRLLLDAQNEIKVLEEAVKRLKKDGLNGVPCQLPLTYLCRAGAQLLSEAKERIRKRELNQNQPAITAEEHNPENSRAMEELYKQKEAVFEASLGQEEQAALIKAILAAVGAKEDGGVRSTMAKRSAVEKWWAENYEK